jgi:hypothetical protein
MSLLSRLAFAVERLADLLPSTSVGQFCVTEDGQRSVVEVDSRLYPAPWFEYHVEYYSDGMKVYYIYLGSLQIAYDPPSVFRASQARRAAYRASLDVSAASASDD